MPISEIANELEQSLDLLTARYESFPARQRSIKAVIESSWRHLQRAEASILMQIAVCCSGFRYDAIASIAAASYTTLAVLVEHSLLRLLPNGRYAMHEMIRQFALDQLQQSGQETEIRQRHADYYLRLLAAEVRHLVGAGQQKALGKLDAERDNLRAAWAWSVENERWDVLDQALDGIYNLYHIRSLYQEGDELCSLALQNLMLDQTKPHTALRARLLARCGSYRFALGDTYAASHLLEQSFSLLREEEASQETAFVRTVQGQLAGWQGDRLHSRQYLAESLTLYQAANDRHGVASVQHKLAQLACSYGEYALGSELAEESLLLCNALGRSDWCAYALDVLGWATFCLGQYAEALQHYWCSLDLFEQSGDRLGVALALGGVGSVMWAMGEATLSDGKRYMEQSLALCREISHRQHMSSRLWYLAQFANESHDFEAAQMYAQAGLALAQEIDSRIFTAYNLCASGETRWALDELAAAHRMLTQAIKLAAGDKQLPPLLIGLIRMAQLWIKMSEQRHLAESLRQAQSCQAVDLLRFVQHHPACWMPYQQRIQAILAELPITSHPRTAQSIHDGMGLLEDWIAKALSE